MWRLYRAILFAALITLAALVSGAQAQQTGGGGNSGGGGSGGSAGGGGDPGDAARPVFQPQRRLPPPPPRGRPIAPIFDEDDDPEPPPRIRDRPERSRPLRAAQPPRTPPTPPPQAASPAARILAPPVSEARLVPDEVLVLLRGDPGPAGLQRFLRDNRLALIETRRIALLDRNWHRLRILDRRAPRQVLLALRGQARVAAAQPNFVYQLAQPAPPPVTRLPQYAPDKLGLPAAHAVSRGRGVAVGLVDSGVDPAHPEIGAALIKAQDIIAEAPLDAAVADDHGTGMASAIVARAQLLGVAPEASLIAARSFAGAVVDRSGRHGTSWHVLRGMDWAVAEGAKVLNLSFAGPRDPLVGEFLMLAARAGVIPVAAAGNAGPRSSPLFPGADPNVIAVTAVDVGDRAFSLANRGGHVAIAAPGVDVLVAQPRGAYGVTTGTSIATAHVSGLVALLLARDPAMDLRRARALLAATARDLGQPGPDPVFGAGLADGQAALARLGAGLAGVNPRRN